MGDREAREESSIGTGRRQWRMKLRTESGAGEWGMGVEGLEVVSGGNSRG